MLLYWTLIESSESNDSENGNDRETDDSDDDLEAGQVSAVSVGVTEESVVLGKVNTVTGQDGSVKAVITANDVDQMIQSVKDSQDIRKDVIHIAAASGTSKANQTSVALPGELNQKMQENNVLFLKLAFENQGLEMNLSQSRILNSRSLPTALRHFMKPRVNRFLCQAGT